MGVTVIIPTFDEELHVARCLDSVCGWAERVFVVDSGSTDATPALVEGYRDRGVRLVTHTYEGPAHQKNWALEQLDIPGDWVLFLDADESVTPELRDVILRATSGDTAVCGYFLNRRIIWEDRWMRHGGWFPNWNLRLFRKGRARYELREVHEHMLVDGPTAFLRGHLLHEDLRDISFFIAKHNRYSDAEAREYGRVLDGTRDGYARLFTRDPLARRRWIKTRLWARLPCKPLIYFLWAYFVRLGFLDGPVALRFHLMHAMFKQFDALKLWELRRRARASQPTPQRAPGTGSRPTTESHTRTPPAEAPAIADAAR